MPNGARIPALLTLALTLVMLVVGLNPRGFDGGNGVRWEDGVPGTHFARGIAYTPAVLDRARLADGGREWTWQVALRTEPRQAPGFGIIAGLYSGSDSGQLQLAQWRRTLVVMAGDDYAHRDRGARLSYEIGDGDDVLWLDIVQGSDGATLFVNGHPVARNPRAGWPPLGTPAPARLVLGSTVSGQYPWRGTLLGVAVFDHALPADELRDGFAARHLDGDPPRLEQTPQHRPEPLLAFDLTEVSDRRVPSSGHVATELSIPPAYVTPELRALTWPSQWRPPSRSLVIDVVVNLLGFIPFGFCATWLAWAALGGAREVAAHGRILVAAAVAAVLAGVLLSLLIELVQVWLPTRDSSLLDLLMNGLGTAIGAAVFALRWRTPSARSRRP
jgi:hypothetical protein